MNKSVATGALAIGGATLVRLAIAPLRHLSFDEAYYLCAARRNWPIDDHPPFLGALLRVADAIPGPVSLRVRLVPIVLAAVTALAIARLAARFSAAPRRAWAIGAIVATWGIMPMAGGLLCTPDAPLLAALAWTAALCVEEVSYRDLLLVPLAVVAVASKVTAIVPLVALAGGALVARRGLRAALILFGVVLSLGSAAPSLRLQVAHALGRGALATAPHVGPTAALGALVLGQLLLWSPPLLVISFRRHRLLTRVPGLRVAVATVATAVVVSALVSGRPPEPGWAAPAVLLALPAAAAWLASTGPVKRVVLVAAIPAVAALVLWASHVDRGPLARVPYDLTHGFVSADLPPYAIPAWKCVHRSDCMDIDAIFSRYERFSQVDSR